jgi:hypothetical protein
MIVETKLESPRTDVLIVEDERIVARDLQQTLEAWATGSWGSRPRRVKRCSSASNADPMRC